MDNLAFHAECLAADVATFAVTKELEIETASGLQLGPMTYTVVGAQAQLTWPVIGRGD